MVGRLVGGRFHQHAPGFAVGLAPVAADLAADLDQRGGNVAPTQVRGGEIVSRRVCCDGPVFDLLEALP